MEVCKDISENLKSGIFPLRVFLENCLKFAKSHAAGWVTLRPDNHEFQDSIQATNRYTLSPVPFWLVSTFVVPVLNERRVVKNRIYTCHVKIVGKSNNWLQVLGTAERSQIDQRVCQHLHAIVPLLEALKSQQQPFELVFPRKGALDSQA